MPIVKCDSINCKTPNPTPLPPVDCFICGSNNNSNPNHKDSVKDISFKSLKAVGDAKVGEKIEFHILPVDDVDFSKVQILVQTEGESLWKLAEIVSISKKDVEGNSYLSAVISGFSKKGKYNFHISYAGKVTEGLTETVEVK